MSLSRKWYNSILVCVFSMSKVYLSDFVLHTVVVILFGLLLLYGKSVTFGTGIDLYQCYANVFLHGPNFFKTHPEARNYAACLSNVTMHEGSYNKLPAEYPLLSTIPMLLAMVGGNAMYSSVFIFLILVVLLSIYFFLFYYASKKAAFAYLIYVIVGGFGIALERLDIIVGELVLLSLYLANEKKFYSSYIILAIATMFKLVPIFLVLPLFLAEQIEFRKKTPKRFYGLGIFLLTCLIFFIISLGIDAKGTFSPLTYNAERPMQIESVPATIMLKLSSLHIVNTCFGSGFGSFNVYGLQEEKCNAQNYALFNSLFQAITTLGVLIFISGLMYLSKLFLSKKMTLSHFYLGIFLLFLSTSKVFSPQYLLWIFPLIAYIYRFDKVWFIITYIIAFLTTMIYPFSYGHTTFFTPYINFPLFLNSIAIRNLILVLLTFFYIFNIFNIRQRKG